MKTKPAPLTADELFVRAGALTIEEMVVFNRRLVDVINRRQRNRRVDAAGKFSPGDNVMFVSRKRNATLTLKVERVTPAGMVYGRTIGSDEPWKVSATICVKAPTKKAA